MPWKDPKSPKVELRRNLLRAKLYKENPPRFCTKCKVHHPTAEFGSHSHASDGIRPACRISCRQHCVRYRIKKHAEIKKRRDKLKLINPRAKKFLDRWMIRKWFKVGRKTFKLWRSGGGLLPPGLRFPKPIRKGNVKGRKWSLWSNSVVRWFEAQLYARRHEIRAAHKAGLTMAGLKKLRQDKAKVRIERKLGIGLIKRLLPRASVSTSIRASCDLPRALPPQCA